jgi:fructose-bisphosphate aldolase class II
MYTKVNEILRMAEESNTAVISFVCMDYVMARSAVYAAEATNTPALIMLYPEHVTVQKTTGLKGYVEAVKELANEVKAPIGMHLDHNYKLDFIMKAIESGFESIMIDGSMHSLDENIKITREVVEYAHARGVVVEGEIGHVGIAAASDNDKYDLFTRPDIAEIFCRESGIDILAISIGNTHGEYKQKPQLDIKRLEEIKAATNVPLVLHGGTGIPDDQLLLAFSKGVRKLNLGTEYIKKYYNAMQEFIEANNDNPNPVKMINMPEFVQSRLQPYVENRLRTLCNF